MSDYVVHFTKPIDPETDRDGYSPWISILAARVLRPGDKPLGAARRIPEVAHLHRVVCFSEIPLDMLDRLVQRRSLYGIGFSKEFVVAQGGAPLWYLDKEGEQARIIHRRIEDRVNAGVDPDDPFWRLTPFIDNPGNYAGRPYRFEWEREWRVIGEMGFDENDVAFLFLPEDEHEKARQFFADVEIEHSGPPYFCPYVDPRWDMPKIQDALANVPSKPEPSPSAIPWWADPY